MRTRYELSIRRRLQVPGYQGRSSKDSALKGHLNLLLNCSEIAPIKVQWDGVLEKIRTD